MWKVSTILPSRAVSRLCVQLLSLCSLPFTFIIPVNHYPVSAQFPYHIYTYTYSFTFTHTHTHTVEETIMTKQMFLVLKSIPFVSENSTLGISALFIGMSDTGHTQCGDGDKTKKLGVRFFGRTSFCSFLYPDLLISCKAHHRLISNQAGPFLVVLTLPGLVSVRSLFVAFLPPTNCQKVPKATG